MSDLVLTTLISTVGAIVSATIMVCAPIIIRWIIRKGGKKGAHPKSANSNRRKIIAMAMVFVVAFVVIFVILRFIAPTQNSPLPTLETSTPCLITNLGWIEYQNNSLGSTINVSPVLGTNCAIKTSFDLKTNDWVATYKKLEPNLLLQGQGIRFSYGGTGVANTLEFKLIEKDASGNETIFYAKWDGATFTAGKIISLDIYYRDLICRAAPGSRCLTGAEHINPGQVDRIDFSFSNKSNNLPGQGEVIIEEIQLIP